jgi:hypothetical protein
MFGSAALRAPVHLQQHTPCTHMIRHVASYNAIISAPSTPAACALGFPCTSTPCTPMLVSPTVACCNDRAGCTLAGGSAAYTRCAPAATWCRLLPPGTAAAAAAKTDPTAWHSSLSHPFLPPPPTPQLSSCCTQESHCTGSLLQVQRCDGCVGNYQHPAAWNMLPQPCTILQQVLTNVDGVRPVTKVNLDNLQLLGCADSCCRCCCCDWLQCASLSRPAAAVGSLGRPAATAAGAGG